MVNGHAALFRLQGLDRLFQASLLYLDSHSTFCLPEVGVLLQKLSSFNVHPLQFLGATALVPLIQLLSYPSIWRSGLSAQHSLTLSIRSILTWMQVPSPYRDSTQLRAVDTVVQERIGASVLKIGRI